MGIMSSSLPDLSSASQSSSSPPAALGIGMPEGARGGMGGAAGAGVAAGAVGAEGASGAGGAVGAGGAAGVGGAAGAVGADGTSRVDACSIAADEAASSSSCCFFASAWRSDQVSFLPLVWDAMAGEGVVELAGCCWKAANLSPNLPALGMDTGV